MHSRKVAQDKIYHDRHGFTLVELMIVVAILSILGAMAVPIYKQYVDSSQKTAASNVLASFPILLETYRAENGSMSPDCDGTTNCTKIYKYSEDDNGDEDTAGASIKATYPSFQARPTTTDVSLYDYTLTITVTGCPAACEESATATAIPVTSRGAPSGNVTADPYR